MHLPDIIYYICKNYMNHNIHLNDLHKNKQIFSKDALTVNLLYHKL